MNRSTHPSIHPCSFHFFRHHLTTLTFTQLWDSNDHTSWDCVVIPLNSPFKLFPHISCASHLRFTCENLKKKLVWTQIGLVKSIMDLCKHSLGLNIIGPVIVSWLALGAVHKWVTLLVTLFVTLLVDIYSVDPVERWKLFEIASKVLTYSINNVNIANNNVNKKWRMMTRGRGLTFWPNFFLSSLYMSCIRFLAVEN